MVWVIVCKSGVCVTHTLLGGLPPPRFLFRGRPGTLRLTCCSWQRLDSRLAVRTDNSWHCGICVTEGVRRSVVRFFANTSLQKLVTFTALLPILDCRATSIPWLIRILPSSSWNQCLYPTCTCVRYDVSVLCCRCVCVHVYIVCVCVVWMSYPTSFFGSFKFGDIGEKQGE